MHVFTKNGLSALQFVSVSPSAEAVDEVTQLIHMLQLSSHYHLFTHQVGLRQVCSSLRTQPKVHCHMLEHQTRTVLQSLVSYQPGLHFLALLKCLSRQFRRF